MKTFKQLREDISLQEEAISVEELVTKIEQLHKKAFPKSWFKIKKSSFGGNAAVGMHFGIVPESEVPNKILDNDPGHHRFMIFVRGEDDYEVKVTLGSIYIVPEKGVNLEMQSVKTKFRKVKGNSAKVLKAFTTFFPRMKKIVTDNADNIYGGDRYSKGIFESVAILEKSKLHPDLVKIDKEIDAFHKKTKHHQYLPRKDADILAKLSKKRDAIWRDVGGDDYSRMMTDSVNEATKWKKGDGKPQGAAHIENVKFWDLPDSSLRYIQKDAHDAMKANPEGKKAGKYADEVNDAATVLFWRKKNKISVNESVDVSEGLAPLGNNKVFNYEGPKYQAKAEKSKFSDGWRSVVYDVTNKRDSMSGGVAYKNKADAVGEAQAYIDVLMTKRYAIASDSRSSNLLDKALKDFSKGKVVARPYKENVKRW